MKYCPEIVKNICELIETDSYTVKEICGMVGINQDTYYDWKNNKPEFSEAVKKAKDKFDLNLVAAAKKSLLKRISGFDYEETKTVYEGSIEDVSVIKEKTVTVKHVAPSDVAIIFALTNKAPDEYKHKQTTSVELPKNLPITFIPDNLTYDELIKLRDSKGGE